MARCWLVFGLLALPAAPWAPPSRRPVRGWSRPVTSEPALDATTLDIEFDRVAEPPLPAAASRGPLANTTSDATGGAAARAARARFLCTAPPAADGGTVSLLKQAAQWAGQNRSVVLVLAGASVVMYGFWRFSMRIMHFFTGTPPATIFSFGLAAGVVTAMIGPSGCGKSTLLRSVNRINERLGYVRTTGTIRVYGEDIYAETSSAIQVRRHIGMVFQRPNPLPLSVRNNVLFGHRLHRTERCSRAEEDEIVEQALRQVLLWDRVKDKLSTKATTLSQLYELSVSEAARVCRPGGVLVALSTHKHLLSRMVRTDGKWEPISRHELSFGGLTASAISARRRQL